MPSKLLPHLRFLNPSLPIARFSTMKPNPSSYRVIPVFSRIFPHKLKYQCLSRKLGVPSLLSQQNPGQFGIRRFGTRSIRPRSDSSDRVRASKSLIDDESELSDWVSGLGSDSFVNRNDGGSSRGRGRGRGRDSDERGGRDRDRVPSVKRGRDTDSDEYEKSSWRMGRDSFGSFSGNSRGKSRFGDESEGKDEGFVSRRRDNGWRSSSEVSPIAKRVGRSSELGYGRDRGDGGNGGSKKFGRSSEASPIAKGGGSESEFRRDRERGGGDNGGLKKFGRSSEFSPIAKRAGRGSNGELKKFGKSVGKSGFFDSDEGSGNSDDEEGEGTLMESITDLISEEDSEEDDDGGGDNMLENAGSLFESKKEANPRDVPTSPGRSDSYLSETRFDQCSVSPLSLKGIKDAGYEKMTVVQETTLPVILKGKDVLAKAKTGTGKTVAFLLPSIEVVVKSPPAGRDQKQPPILVLVICPTRELAGQAAAEANSLLKYHPSIGVQVVIGGTRLALEQKRMQANPCQILVATPGRLKDHIENTAGFATRLMGVKVLVLDEADHLLDMGFRKDIEKIIAAVPKQRQTLLFSATVPDEVRQICHIALKRDHEFIDTVGVGSEDTHSQVRQGYLIAPLDKHFSLLYVLLKEHISDDVDYKVLVFCTTAMVTRLVADLLGELNLNVREIHSRKPQSYRTRVSDEFRKSKGLILVTSDVSARGVDYPDVTLVIQVGLPSDREQYIHRLGRTGRKGKEGQGILLLAPWEECFLSTIKDLPITKVPVPSCDPETKKKVSINGTYSSFLIF
ncbi:RNA helicase [Sarracenia purpurea var. burkii]